MIQFILFTAGIIFAVTLSFGSASVLIFAFLEWMAKKFDAKDFLK